jgi:hypothetical protein
MQTGTNTAAQNTNQINNQQPKAQSKEQKPKKDHISSEVRSMFKNLTGTGRRRWQPVVTA